MGSGPIGRGGQGLRLVEAERQGEALVSERLAVRSCVRVAFRVVQGQDLVRDETRVFGQRVLGLRGVAGPADGDTVRDVQAAVLAGLLDQADGITCQPGPAQFGGDLQVEGDCGT